MSDPDARTTTALAAHADALTPGPAPLGQIVARGRRIRRHRRIASGAGVLGLAAVVLAGVVAVRSGATRAAPTTIAPAPAPAPRSLDPAALVGSWHVVAAGVDPATVLVLGEVSTLVQPCGVRPARWRADATGVFLAGVFLDDAGRCNVPAGAELLETAARFTVGSAGSPQLLDASGRLLATLVAGAPLPAGVPAPALTPGLAAYLAIDPALPEGYVAPTPAQLTGDWQATTTPIGALRRMTVSFAADGTELGSDGCNDYGGRWEVGAGGAWLSGFGSATLVGCPRDTTYSVDEAGRVGVDGTTLVFFDGEGHPRASFVRSAARDSPTTEPTATPAVSGADALVGAWTVTGPGVEVGTVAVIGDNVTFIVGCGRIDSSWAATNGGAFLTETSSSSGACPPSAPAWLPPAAGFRVRGDGSRLLLDRAGGTVATLRPDTGSVPSDLSEAATPSLAARLADALPLPAGYAAPTAAQLLGTWRPTASRTRLTIDFRADGSYVDADDCHHLDGRWAVTARGEWAAVTGRLPFAGCSSGREEGVATARRVGLHDGELIFFDNAGKELARLVRP